MNNKPSVKMIYGGYTRKSTESEDRQVLSIDAQLDKNNEIAEKLGVRIVKELTFSESKSAKVTNNRPKFREMIDKIEAEEMNGIIVWHPDRLSRNAIDSALLIDLMDREKLVEIVTPTQTFRNTPIDKFMFSLMCNQAKMENDKKGIDVARGLEKKAKMGIFPGGPPLGYKNDKYAEKGSKGIESDVSLPIIRKMFDLMLTGNYNPMQIRRIATDEWGYRTPKGKKIGRSTIYGTFSNTFYYGDFEYPKGSGDWYHGIHEAIITEEEYDKVQFLLGRAGRPRPKKHVFAFIGMMRCGECGAMVTAETKIKKQQNGNVHSYIYYHCTKRKDPNCSQGSLEEKKLIQQVSKEIESIEMPPEFHSFAMKWWRKENEQEITKRNTVVSSQQKAYKACLAKIDGLMDMRSLGEITSEEYTAKKTKLLEEKKEIEKGFNDTGKRIDQWEKAGDEMLTFIETAVEKFKHGPLTTKRGILSTLGSDLVMKDKILKIDIEKSLFPLKRIREEVHAIKERLEPLDTVEKQEQFERLCEQSPRVLGYKDSNLDTQDQNLMSYH